MAQLAHTVSEFRNRGRRGRRAEARQRRINERLNNGTYTGGTSGRSVERVRIRTGRAVRTFVRLANERDAQRAQPVASTTTNS